MEVTTEATLTELRSSVSKKYGKAASRVIAGETASCCSGSSACCGATTEAWDPITSNLYDEQQAAEFPPKRCSRPSAAGIPPRSPR